MSQTKTTPLASGVIEITGIIVLDPANNNQPLLKNGIGTLVFTDLPVLTIVTGTPFNGGPLPATPYTVQFSEKGYQMHLAAMIFPASPSSPPYIFTWKAPLDGGVAVTDVSVYDNTADHYAILDPSGNNESSGTFYQGQNVGNNYFMLIKAASGSIVNGGPVFLDNNSIHYTDQSFDLTLAELLYQGQTATGLYIFQQIDG